MVVEKILFKCGKNKCCLAFLAKTVENENVVALVAVGRRHQTQKLFAFLWHFRQLK